jgi:hypothetical protein
MPSAVRIERVAAMHADLDLGLGLGSHTGQGTRHGPKSLLISDRRRAIALRKTHGLQCKATSFAPAELIIF